MAGFTVAPGTIQATPSKYTMNVTSRRAVDGYYGTYGMSSDGRYLFVRYKDAEWDESKSLYRIDLSTGSKDPDHASREFLVDVSTVGGEHSGPVVAVWELPNGELMLCAFASWTRGRIIVSDGYPTLGAGCSWSVTQETSGLLGLDGKLRGNVYVNGSWSFSAAPKGHVREGLVVICTYGGHSNANDTSATAPVYVYLSTDYGRTWRTILNIWDDLGLKTNQHMHGVCYDPWTDAIITSFGDGYGGPPQQSAIMCTRDWWRTDGQKPTWEFLVPYQYPYGYQIVGMHATPHGIVCGSDSAPDGMVVIPRTQDGYGDIFGIVTRSQRNVIAQRIFQRDPGSLIVAGIQNGDSSPEFLRIYGTPDGADFYVLWESAEKAPTWSLMGDVYGPDVRGEYHWHTTHESATNGTFTYYRGVLPA